MDLNLVTGKPGASKTLNTIKDVEQRRIEEGRPVYYYGISDLALPWVKMDGSEKLADDPTLITPHSWWQAPPGAIIVIDEAQDHFPAASLSAKAPEYIAKFGQFRHLGFSMYLITQAPLLINPRFKAWVQPHIHYKRLWGGFRVVKFINESMITEINSSKISETAIKKFITIDKSVFKLYKSAELHTQNRRVNKKMWLMLLLPLFLVPFLFYTAFKLFQKQYDDLSPEEDVSSKSEVVEQESFVSDGFFSMPASAQTAFNPLVDYQPRIEAMPETAPAYDELRKPQDFPRPQCVLHPKSGGCNCYTQQATLMTDYPKDLCMAYVKHGYFDATKPRLQAREIARRDNEPPPGRSVSAGGISANAPTPSVYMRADGTAMVPDAFRNM